MSFPAATRNQPAAGVTGADGFPRAARALALDAPWLRRSANYGFSPYVLRTRYDNATEEAV